MGIKQRQARERRQKKSRILIAAQKVFVRKGYEPTTIDDIALEGEISTGTVYNYFQSKSELYVTLARQALVFVRLRLREEVSIRQKPVSRPPRSLADIFIEALHFDREGLTLALVVLAGGQVQRTTPQLRQDVEGMVAEIQDLTAVLQEHKEKGGGISGGSPQDTARLIWSALGGIVLFEASRPAGTPDRTDRLLALVSNALAAPVQRGHGWPRHADARTARKAGSSRGPEPRHQRRTDKAGIGNIAGDLC